MSLDDKLPLKASKPMTPAEMQMNMIRRACAYGYRCNRVCESKNCYEWKEGQDKLARRYNYGQIL